MKRLLATAASLACCLALASCNGNGTPAHAHAKAHQSSGSASPSAHPTLPASTLASAKKFTSQWVGTLNTATTTGNTTKLKAISAKSCTACTDFAKQLDVIYAAGGHVDSKGWSVQRIIPIEGNNAKEPGLYVTVTIAPQKVYRKKGSKPQTYKGGDKNFQFFLLRKGDGWVMQRIDV